jgi:stage II sporulation protein GA (sporulation sigma-E factor processing peptidase)
VTSHGGLAFWTGLGTLALLVAMPIAAALLRAVLGHVRRQQIRQASLVRVAAGLGERTVSFMGLVDTGNQLRDPITRRPVCLVEGRVLAELFPESVRPRLQSGAEWHSVVTELGDDPLVRRLSFIPFRGAGGVEQFTIAIKPDVVLIEREGRLVPATQPCLLAVHPGALAHDNTFQAILHTEVLTGVDGDDGKHQAAETTPAAALASEAVVDADSHPLGGRS